MANSTIRPLSPRKRDCDTQYVRWTGSRTRLVTVAKRKIIILAPNRTATFQPIASHFSAWSYRITLQIEKWCNSWSSESWHINLIIFDLLLHFLRRQLEALEEVRAPTGAQEARASPPVRVSLRLSVSARLLPASHKAKPTPGLEQVAGLTMGPETTSKTTVSILLHKVMQSRVPYRLTSMLN